MTHTLSIESNALRDVERWIIRTSGALQDHCSSPDEFTSYELLICWAALRRIEDKRYPQLGEWQSYLWQVIDSSVASILESKWSEDYLCDWEAWLQVGDGLDLNLCEERPFTEIQSRNAWWLFEKLDDAELLLGALEELSSTRADRLACVLSDVSAWPLDKPLAFMPASLYILARAFTFKAEEGGDGVGGISIVKFAALEDMALRSLNKAIFLLQFT